MILREPQDICNFFGCFMVNPEGDFFNLYPTRPGRLDGDSNDVVGWLISEVVAYEHDETEYPMIWEPHVLFDHSAEIYNRPEYRLVKGTFDSITAEMTKLSRQGWYPSGQMFVQGDTFYQVMALRIRRAE